MKRYSWLFAILLCSVVTFSFCAFAEDGEDLMGSLGEAEIANTDAEEDKDATAKVEAEEKDDGKTLTEEAKEKEEKAKEENSKEEEKDYGMATLPKGPGYVGVYSYVNLRDAVWGNIQAQMLNNEKVTIVGHEKDWYKVETTKGNGYIHARYVFKAPDMRYAGNEVYEWDNPNGYSGSSNSPSGTSNTVKDVIINVDGDSVQGKVVNAAKQIHDKYQGYQAFPYDPLTEGGNLGCAQVATTVLKAAGVLNTTCLNCTGTISLLEQAGWKSVSWPPYQAGDVVFWETYLPGPSHVGIVMNSGNSAQAMNNSSSKRCPQYSDITSMKICKIMRKL